MAQGTHKKIIDISSCGLPGEQRSAVLGIHQLFIHLTDKTNFPAFSEKRKKMCQNNKGEKLRSDQQVLTAWY